MSHTNMVLAPLGVLFLLAFGTGEPRAQQAATSDSLFRATIAASRHTLALDRGRLTGPGAEFLLGEGARARFFMVGEEHGVADVPEFTAAALRALREHGYDRLVVETSPTTSAALDRAARGGRDSLSALFARFPLAVPFYDLHEEADLLVGAVEEAGSAPVIWGVDYEFVFGAALALTELERAAPTAEARALAGRYREQAEAGQRAFSGADPGPLFFVQAGPGDFAALRAVFAADPGAVALVDGLEASAEAWRLQFAGENYRSNEARTALLRANFAEAYGRAFGDPGAGHKAVLKFGANHLFRGHTPVHVLDLGTTASVLAEAEGDHTFNVMAVAGRGSEQTYFDPTSPGTRPTEMAAWMLPLYDAADPERWTVFDLRPLRPLLHAGRIEVAPELERLIWGYDAFLILSGSRPAGFGPRSGPE
ncbi:MAG TPA: hypothetical protein VGB53_16250 [Rubricoccaceae bacterium]|jgi:hypothetical protein